MSYYCQHCGKRLPVIEVGSSATVFCKHCKNHTRVESKAAKIDARPPAAQYLARK